MKKIIENLYGKTEHLLSESIIGDVADLLGVEADSIEKDIENLSFADYLELGNAVGVGDKELAQEILGLSGDVDEYSAFDADDDEDEDEDTGVNFVDQLEGDYDEDDDLFDDDYDGLEEADNAYGGAGDNSFSAPKNQPQATDDDEQEDEIDDLASLKPEASKAAALKKQTSASAQLTPQEKEANYKKMKDLKPGDDVFVVGVDGKPKKAKYKGSTPAGKEEFLANIRPKEGSAQGKDRRMSYSNVLSPFELAQESVALDEKAPPGMENWIRARKAEFKKRYGDRWQEILYATAWKQYNKNESIEESYHMSNSVKAVEQAIWHRIRVRHLDLLDKYGIDALNRAVESVSSFHGVDELEELGSSDVSIMVQQVIDELASEYPNAGCKACEGAGLDAWGDRCPDCYGHDRIEFSEERLRRLAGLSVKETATGGATGAGAIASAPVAVGGMQKRNPSIYATATKPEPKPRKKGKKGEGVGRDKKA